MSDADDPTFNIPADDLSQRDPNSGRTNYVHEPADPPVPLGAGERHEIDLEASERARRVVCTCGQSWRGFDSFYVHAQDVLRTLLDESRAEIADRQDSEEKLCREILELDADIARLTAERDAAMQRAKHAETDRGIAEEELKVFKEYVAVNEASLREMGVKLLQRTAAAHAAGRREAIEEACKAICLRCSMGAPVLPDGRHEGMMPICKASPIRALLSEAK